MVWGAIRYGWRSDLVVIEGNLNAARYCDEIIRPHVLPHIAANPQVTFQQDNARPHSARVTQQLLADNNVRVLDWPPYSPDMNVIEHVWDLLDRRVRQRTPAPSTGPQLREAVQEEWRAIPQRQIDRIILSMPRRLRSLVRARGAHTEY